MCSIPADRPGRGSRPDSSDARTLTRADRIPRWHFSLQRARMTDRRIPERNHGRADPESSAV